MITKRKSIGTRIVNTLCTGLAALIMHVTPARAEQGWATIQPAANVEQKQATVRVEGGSQLGKRLNFYSFLDVDPTKDDHVDFENFYGEARVNYSLGGLNSKIETVSPAVEYDGGTGLEDFVRLGLTWTPHLWKDNFTLIKTFPYSTNDNGPQLSLFTAQNFAQRIAINVLADYNPRDNVLYIEAGGELKFTSKISGTVQARSVITSDDHTTTPYIGAKYSF